MKDSVAFQYLVRLGHRVDFQYIRLCAVHALHAGDVRRGGVFGLDLFKLRHQLSQPVFVKLLDRVEQKMVVLVMGFTAEMKRQAALCPLIVPLLNFLAVDQRPVDVEKEIIPGKRTHA
ncbi:MAG: hypothetical protein BWY83_02643 [bacterium ADurb.Bin478]|nr:MAG: hypothetical protein BWY83_02643 [bacterium ADurb.Bin478]